jgi:hypothetical protein
MDKQAELQQWLEIADKDLNLAEFASALLYTKSIREFMMLMRP